MRRNILVIASVLIVFVILLVARLPASWLLNNFASHLPLAYIEGTAWNGSASVTHPAFPLEKIQWQISPWSLLAGEATAEISIDEPGVQLLATVAASSQAVRVDLETANIDASRLNKLGVLPYGSAIAGDLVFENILIEKQAERFTLAEGEIRWLPAYLVAPQAISLQGYKASIQHEDNKLLVYIKDQGGPLKVEGLAMLEANLQYDYTVNINLVEQAPAEVQAGLTRLGRIDADGVVNMRGKGRLF